MTTTKILDIDGVRKSYGAVTVLDGIRLSVAAGSRTAIVGPSGSGKTTLLRIIAGFEVPDAGTVTVGGTCLANGPDAVPAHQRGIGFVPQDGALFPHLTIADNVGFGLPRSLAGRTQRIRELMQLVSLDEALLRRRPHELSGGQQQRVALARAMAQQPRLMLLDEPFSALDTGLRAATRKAVAALLAQTGITAILVTHDQAEALSFADQVAVMRAGTLVQVGSPQALYHHPRDADTARFLGDCIVLDAELRQGQARCALGTIPVADTQREGSAHIMLRPEQLELGPQDGAGVRAEVVDTDFGGASCTVRVQLTEHNVAPMEVRSPSLALPAVGSMVSVQVRGEAHVFA